jgi:hypothetical protein
LSLDGQGGFVLTEWVLSNGAVSRQMATGTYTIGSDCSLRLTFSPLQSGGSTGSIANLPTSFRGLLVSNSQGLVSFQPTASSTNTVTGVFVNQ